jgi:hypothetical protein
MTAAATIVPRPRSPRPGGLSRSCAAGAVAPVPGLGATASHSYQQRRGRRSRGNFDGGVLTDDEAAHYRRGAADAVAAALRLARSEMPEASDARLLLMILGNAAACCGRLRVEYPDVLSNVSGLYQKGTQLPPLSAPRQGSTSTLVEALATGGEIRRMTDSTESLIAYCRENRRVCPMPRLWTELWEMLPNRPESGAAGSPHYL